MGEGSHCDSATLHYFLPPFQRLTLVISGLTRNPVVHLLRRDRQGCRRTGNKNARPPRAAALPVPLSENRRDGSCPCSAIGLRFAFARPCPGERLRRGTAAPGSLVMPGSDRRFTRAQRDTIKTFNNLLVHVSRKRDMDNTGIFIYFREF